MNYGELNDEMRAHLREKIADLVESGMSESDARAQALREFGNRALHLEDSRAVWRWAWLDRLSSDLHYAVRGIRRSPGFTALVIATLAIGIGANTAIFSAVNSVLIRPLPYPSADRLTWITTYHEEVRAEALQAADYFDWREQAQSFDAMMAYNYGTSDLAAGDEADRVRLVSVSGDFWSITGGHALLGRTFAPEEQNAIVLSYALFERRFKGDPAIVGRSVTLEGAPARIVGVLPPDFRFLFPMRTAFAAATEIDAYAASPLTANNQKHPTAVAIVSAVARRKPGVSIAAAQAEVEGIERRIAAQWGRVIRFTGIHARAQPLQEKLVEGSRPALLVLLGAVGFVLLIACANVANLLLVRATSCQREISIRAALGAGRWRVARQFLTESLLLALLGGAAGLLLAHWAIQLLARFGPADVPRLRDIRIDGRVLLFALAASAITGALFGAAPALSFSKGNLHEVLKESGRMLSAGAAAKWLRAALATLEIALALVLLSGAGLMIKSFSRMNQRAPGFDPERTLVMKVALSGPAYRSEPQQLAYLEEALRRLAAAPGVESAGAGNTPLMGIFSVDDVPLTPGVFTTTHSASAGYARALGLRQIEGRWLTDHEPDPVIVVNQTFAKLVARDDHPIGKHTDRGMIVGVVADLKVSKLDTDNVPEIYVPLTQSPWLRSADVAIRLNRNPRAAAPEITKLIAGIDKTQPVYDVQTLEQLLADSIAPRRFNMFLLGIFAAIAVALAAIGIYGIMSYAVTQRTQEIGVRIALGARQGEVVRMVVKQGMLITAAGVASGLACALWLTRLMASLVYGVEPWDRPTFAAVSLALMAAALTACWIPARRAARVDPVVALRYE